MKVAALVVLLHYCCACYTLAAMPRGGPGFGAFKCADEVTRVHMQLMWSLQVYESLQ